jgi:dynein heavy chain, axonemal
VANFYSESFGCRRLKLGSLEPLLQVPDVMTQRRVEVALRQLPAEWTMRCDMAREEIAWTLQSLSANALELASLWVLAGFPEKLLVEVAGPNFSSKVPMDALDFELMQHESHEKVKASLWTHWLPKSAEVFRLLPPICINGDAQAYYRSIATLQGRQLRQLVQDSVDAYVHLFEQHQGMSAAKNVICCCQANAPWHDIGHLHSA